MTTAWTATTSAFELSGNAPIVVFDDADLDEAGQRTAHPGSEVGPRVQRPRPAAIDEERS
jgi:hypothetical protein